MSNEIETASQHGFAVSNAEPFAKTASQHGFAVSNVAPFIKTASHHGLALVTTSFKIKTMALHGYVIYKPHVEEQPKGGGLAFYIRGATSNPTTFHVDGVKARDKSVCISIYAGDKKIVMHRCSGDVLSDLRADALSGTLKFVFYKNYVTVEHNGFDIGFLFGSEMDYDPRSFGISGISGNLAEAKLIEFPDASPATFIETDNTPGAAMAQAIGDRPITASPRSLGGIELFVNKETPASIHVDDANNLTVRTPPKKPSRAAVFSYSVFGMTVPSSDNLGTAVVRMNCDAIPLYYAERAIRAKFGRRVGVSLPEIADVSVGDMVTISAIPQSDSSHVNITGIIAQKSITPRETTYELGE